MKIKNVCFAFGEIYGVLSNIHNNGGYGISLIDFKLISEQQGRSILAFRRIELGQGKHPYL